jgi:hypothetical protein
VRRRSGGLREFCWTPVTSLRKLAFFTDALVEPTQVAVIVEVERHLMAGQTGDVDGIGQPDPADASEPGVRCLALVCVSLIFMLSNKWQQLVLFACGVTELH